MKEGRPDMDEDLQTIPCPECDGAGCSYVSVAVSTYSVRSCPLCRGRRVISERQAWELRYELAEADADLA